jgi:hypothetical protein
MYVTSCKGGEGGRERERERKEGREKEEHHTYYDIVPSQYLSSLL